MNFLLADRFFANANHLEAGLWMVIGAGFLIHAAVKTAFRRSSLVAGVTFIAFGMSDVVEVRTGAWWRPWWLFGWKAICVLTIAILLIRYLKYRRANRGYISR